MIAPFYEYRYGGAELIMRIQRQCLEERGIQIHVLCLADGSEPQDGIIWRLPLPDWLKKHPLAVKRAIIFLNNPWFDRYFLKVMRQMPIPLEGYDLFHCQTHYWLDMGLHLALKQGKPLALTFHDNLPREIPRELMNPLFSVGLQWVELLQGRYLRPVLRQCRWINGVSDHVDKKLARYLQPDGPPIFTVYNPPPPVTLSDSPPRLPGAPPRVLYIGRLSKEKGLDVLLDAFKDFPERMELTILGLEGPLQAMAQEAAKRDPRVRLHPPVPHAQVQRYFQNNDVICCPSVWNDPLPGTVIETRLYQKAILTTDRGGIPEILAGYTKAAIVKTEGLKRRQLVDALRAELTQAANLIDQPVDFGEETRFLNQFSRQSFADQYFKLYVYGRLDHAIQAD